MNTIIDNVSSLVRKLDLAQNPLVRRERRYSGESNIAYTSDFLIDDYRFLNSNLFKLAVDSVAERIRPSRVECRIAGKQKNEVAKRYWDNSFMPQKISALVADALALGSAYMIVWHDGASPFLSAESARGMTARHDPVTGRVVDAVKRYYERTPEGGVAVEHVIYYGSDAVVHFERAGNGGLKETKRVENPLGVPPVVSLINKQRLGAGDVGASVIDSMEPLVDMLNKLLADLATASEATARPKRWATGISLEEVEDGFTADGDEPVQAEVTSPFSEADGVWTSENESARFGVLDGSSLTGFDTACSIVLEQISAVSCLPGHLLGVRSSQPASADAVRATEAGLTARAEQATSVFAPDLELATRLLIAVGEGVPLSQVEVRISWADPATRSEAQAADAVSKLYSLGIITVDEARQRMGLPVMESKPKPKVALL